MSNNIIIRSYNQAHDLQQVHQLNLIINSEQPEQEVLEEIKNYNGDIFVALKDKEIIGFISLSQPLWNNVVIIEHLVVDKAQRRYGVGKELLDYVITEAKKRKARVICVQTAVWNWDGIKFYRREGFIPRAILPDYFGDNVDLIWLDLRLE